MTGLLDGRVAVVTGGARGIGAAIATTFARHGARVLVADLDATEAVATAASITGAGGVAHGVGLDVSDPDSVAAAVATAERELGPLAVYVNNAGVTRDATIAKMSVDDFDTVLSVHLRGSWLGTKFAAAAMRAHGGGGALVNMSSTSGKGGAVGQTNYSAAKAGVIGLTKAAAKELAHHGIRVNAVLPGLIRTRMTEAMPPHVWDQKLAEVPLGRAGEPEDVANAALYLASDLASYVTGAVVEVTGGRFM